MAYFVCHELVHLSVHSTYSLSELSDTIYTFVLDKEGLFGACEFLHRHNKNKQLIHLPTRKVFEFPRTGKQDDTQG